jgi:Tfp pilus assembly protein PilZ
MAADKGGDKKADEKRRAGGAIRVPFVRRCQLDYGGGQSTSAFIVNINVLGAYVESETMPALGRAVVCRFQVPGNELDVVADGVVAWTNPQQEHPVHSLPPGFGVAFRNLSADVRTRIEQIVTDYLARQASD